MSVTIRCTRDYKIFEASIFNRDVGKTEVLRKSMEKHGYIPAYPLHVVRNGDGKFTVKGGHHRLEVARSLGIGVYYVVCEDGASVCDLEMSTRAWKFPDFFGAWCRSGDASYLAVKEFSDRTGICLKQSASLLADEAATSGNQQARIKNGTYKTKDPAHAEAVAEVVTQCKEAGVAFATTTNFVGAISAMVRTAEFDSLAFVRRIGQHGSLLQHQATLSQYLEAIETVYNYKNQNKVPLAFIAKETARKRSAVQREAA